jgi:hypothetical protein
VSDETIGGWHYQKAGRQFGPVQIECIQLLLCTGVLSSNAKVWRPGLPDWINAREATESRELTPRSLLPDFCTEALESARGPLAVEAFGEFLALTLWETFLSGARNKLSLVEIIGKLLNPSEQQTYMEMASHRARRAVLEVFAFLAWNCLWPCILRVSEREDLETILKGFYQHLEVIVLAGLKSAVQNWVVTGPDQSTNIVENFTTFLASRCEHYEEVFFAHDYSEARCGAARLLTGDIPELFVEPRTLFCLEDVMSSFSAAYRKELGRVLEALCSGCER